MTTESAQLQPDYAGPILAPDEPPPYRLYNTRAGAALLIVCDHASNRMPRSLDRLGVPAPALDQHVAYDIGSAAVTQHLAQWLDAPAILGEYSRLVVDTNRFSDDPTSIMKISDGVVVPGNHDISEEQAAQRAEEIFHPFHRAVDAELDRIRRRGDVPIVVSVHSFTPVFAGHERPWHIGVLWHEDFRLARRMLDALRADPALCVGENEPYHARKPLGYTVVTHAEATGLPHLLLEIRQDLIADDAGAEHWALVSHTALAPIVADRALYQLWIAKMRDPAFTIGIEEEYMIVDPETRDLIHKAPRSLLPECKRRLNGQVSPEFLQCQIEVGTPVSATIQEAREHLVSLRRTVGEVVREHGLAMIAASTHPFAMGEEQLTTPKARYRALAEDLQAVVRRLLISGMHVHVGIDDDELRIDLLSQVMYVLPHLLALSTSSPFWKGSDTGLKSYRISVWDEMPRTGLPETFESFAEYERHVDVLVKAGIIEDATKIWWDVRPSDRFPTLEMRIADIWTRLEDGICIAALYLCWLRMLYRLRRGNKRWRRYATMLIEENRWRAHRYGIDAGLIDFGLGEITPYTELLEEMLALIAEDAEFLGCTEEVNHARHIVANGTSAHRQIAVYREARDGGAEREEAIKMVVDALIDDTQKGVT